MMNESEKKTRGGAMYNAGRPQKYNEKTKSLSFKVPISKYEEIRDYIVEYLKQFIKIN